MTTKKFHGAMPALITPFDERGEVDVGKLRDRMRPVIAKFGVNVGQDVVKELQDELAKARK